MLNWRNFQYLSLPLLCGVPSDANIVAVEWSVRHQAWAVVVEHPSFPVHEIGQEIAFNVSSLDTLTYVVEIPEEFRNHV